MGPMKKLLIFGPANSPHLLNWALPFRDTFQLKILTFHMPTDDLDYKGIESHHLKPITGTKLDYFLQVNRVQKFVADLAPEIIHAHYASSYGFICTAIAYQCKKILTVWGSDVMVARNNFIHRFLIDRSLRKFNCINVPSLNLADILKNIGIDSRKILIFQYGIDLEVFDRLKIERKNQNAIQIVSTRNWGPIYNIGLIIEGFKLAYQKNSNLRLNLVGSGEAQDIAQIKDHCKDHPGIIIRGKLSKTELINELWKSDIFISIPSSDGMSLSVLEALYCECYPLLSNIPPNCEILSKGDGINVQEFSAEAVCASMLEAAGKFQEADLSKNKVFVDENANYKKNIKKIDTIYREGG
jgi:glycosyltransferase involved in cell wall biosynthesis